MAPLFRSGPGSSRGRRMGSRCSSNSLLPEDNKEASSAEAQGEE